MAITAPTASGKHYEKTLKGLREILPEPVVMEAVAALGLPATVTADQRIPVKHISTLVDRLAQQNSDPHLLIRAFSRLNYNHQFLRTTFLSSSRTLLEAVRLMQRYMTLDTGLVRVTLESVDGRAYLSLLPIETATADIWQLDALLYAVLRTLQGLGLQSVMRVSLARNATANIEEDLRRLFAAPIELGANSYGLTFPDIELARAIGWQSESIRRIARRERRLIRIDEQHDWTGSVDTLLEGLLRQGRGSIDDCARLLAVSRRTLQRRIEAQGITFRTLLENTRRRLALAYLAEGYALETTALLVGYRQTAQFYRSFRGWFSVSPQTYCHRHGLTVGHLPSTSELNPPAFGPL